MHSFLTIPASLRRYCCLLQSQHNGLSAAELLRICSLEHWLKLLMQVSLHQDDLKQLRHRHLLFCRLYTEAVSSCRGVKTIGRINISKTLEQNSPEIVCQSPQLDHYQAHTTQ